jgi:hypothetical protein
MQTDKVYIALDVLRLGKENVSAEIYALAEKVLKESLTK